MNSNTGIFSEIFEYLLSLLVGLFLQSPVNFEFVLTDCLQLSTQMKRLFIYLIDSPFLVMVEIFYDFLVYKV